MHAFKFCAVTALAALASASAAMAQATQVNIADPTANRTAKVEPGNRLAVQDVAPTTFFHAARFGLVSSNGCVPIALAPSGKALIVRQVRLDITANPSPGPDSIRLSTSPDCGAVGTVFGDVNPQTLGQNTVTFDPGLAIPSGGGLYAEAVGSIAAEAFSDGYTVASAVAPPVGQTLQVYGTAPRQR
jgi:hypothetical protein